MVATRVWFAAAFCLLSSGVTVDTKMRDVGSKGEEKTAMQVNYNGDISSQILRVKSTSDLADYPMEADVESHRIEAFADGASEEASRWGRHRGDRRRATPTPTPRPPAAPGSRDALVQAEMQAISHLETSMNSILQDAKNSNDAASIQRDTDNLKKAAAEAKEAAHAALQAHVGPFSQQERAEVRANALRIQSSSSSLASQGSEKRWGSRRRGRKSEAQKRAAKNEERAAEDLDLEVQKLVLGMEANEEKPNRSSLLSQQPTEGVGDESGDPAGGSGSLFDNIDQLVDGVLEKVQNFVAKAFEAVGLEVGPLKDMIANVFGKVKEFIGNFLGKAGDFWSGLFGGLQKGRGEQ